MRNIASTENKATKTSAQINSTSGKAQSMPFFQTKLMVNQPGDAYEQEADRVADQVMRMPNPTQSKNSVGNTDLGLQRQAIPLGTVGRSVIAPSVQQSNSTPNLVQTKCADCAQKEQTQKEEERPDLGTGQVMRSSKVHDINGTSVVPVQRACKACAEASELQRKETQPDIPGQQTITIQRVCTDCADDAPLQRSESSSGGAGGQTAPAIVSDVLNSGGGRSMDVGTRGFMESRFGQDFGQVRIHTDGKAAESAAAINARAYTSGSNVVFGSGEYQPESEVGRRLLAHELVHVGQQGGGKALSTIQRENEATTTGVTRFRAIIPNSGIAFIPNIVRTKEGYVSGAHGGLLGDRIRRLNVILGENMSPRSLARILLPLWLTADLLVLDDGTMVIQGTLTEEELAKAILIYNDTYLRVPLLSNWISGVRVPLPVEIDTDNVGTLNTSLMKRMATAFDVAWLPILDKQTLPPTSPSNTGRTPQQAAIINSNTQDFLTNHRDGLSRGIALLSMSMTNANETIPLIEELVSQLSEVELRDVAMNFMNNAVSNELDILSTQTAGFLILSFLWPVLPLNDHPEPFTQDEVIRANSMMVQAMNGNNAMQELPAAAPSCSRGIRTVTVDIVQLTGSNRSPEADVAFSNMIFSNCCIQFQIVKNEFVDEPTTLSWLGADNKLKVNRGCANRTTEERRMSRGAHALFGLNSDIKVFYVEDMQLGRVVGVTINRACNSGPFRNHIYLENNEEPNVLAHELGHAMLNSGHSSQQTNLMWPYTASTGNRLTDRQCRTIFNNAR